MTRETVLILLLWDTVAVIVLLTVAVRGVRGTNRVRDVPAPEPLRRPAPVPPGVVSQGRPVVVQPPAQTEPPVVRLPDAGIEPAAPAGRVLQLDRPVVPAPRAGARVPTPREQLDELRWRTD